MKELIEKAAKRLGQQKHVDAKDLAVNTVLPLFRTLWAHFEQMSQNVDANFSDVYEALHLSSDGALVEQVQTFIVEQGSMVDDLMLALGYLQPRPAPQQGYVFSDTVPAELRERYERLEASVLDVMHRLTEIKDLVESDADEDDEDDEEDEDDVDTDDFDDDDDDDDDAGDDQSAIEGEVVNG